MESYGTIFGDQPGQWGATMHQWPENSASATGTLNTDNEWHAYGCLWTSTGSAAGQVKFYFDGVQVGTTIDTGTNQTQSALEGMFVLLVLERARTGT